MGRLRDKLIYYNLWETFFGHLQLQGLEDTILNEPADGEEMSEDKDKNAKAYAELTQLLDDMSLFLVMREAEDYGRKAIKILKDYYAGRVRHLQLLQLQFTDFTSIVQLWKMLTRN